MNTSQIFIVLSVTVIILLGCVILQKNVSSEIFQNGEIVKFVLVILIIGMWMFSVFIIDLYMKSNQLHTELDANYKQIHSDIMKKYINVNEKCGIKV